MKFNHLQMRRSLTPAAARHSEAALRRRLPVHQATKTSGFQQAAAATTDGSVVFKIISQPETQHRARYQTEGSRGAIKDRSGAGYPMVQLQGCSKTTKMQIFIGNDSGKVMPHIFYQVCKVTGKNSNPCDEDRVDGTDIIELLAKPHNDMRVICDCVGILKERITDIEARFPKENSWKSSKKKSTKCRMVFRTVVENRNGQPETLQVVSDVINCTQLPGTPEILKMSPDNSPLEGGGELWMIGKNFLKDTQVCFSYSIDGKEEPLWTKVVEPQQDFFHQSHLITHIPPFFDPTFCGDVEISVFIKCGDKVSEPVPFIYKGRPVLIMYAPTTSDSSDSECHSEKAALSASKAKNPARLGSVSVIKTNHAVLHGRECKKARPTILEPLHSHRSKKARQDHPMEIRKNYSVQRPSLVSENAIFVADTSNKNHSVTTFEASAFPFNRSSEASDLPSNMELLQSQSHPNTLKPDSPLVDIDRDEEQIYPFDDEGIDSNLTKDSLLSESSFSPPRADATNISKLDLSDGFQFDWNNKCNQYGQNTQEPALWTAETGQEIQSDSQVSSANEREDDEKKDTPNISYEATSDDKATISISLPTSILKDQKHFQTVMNTINNALIKHDPTEDGKEETRDEEIGGDDHKEYQMQTAHTQCRPCVSPDQSIPWQAVSQDTGERHRERYHSTPSTLCSTSDTIKTRKRAFTAEGLERKDSTFWDVEVHSSLQFTASSHSKATAEWMPRSQIVAEDEIWNSEIDEMLEAAMDKIPRKAEVSTREVLQSLSDQEELTGMDWSTQTNAVSIPVDFEKDSPRILSPYLVEPVTRLEAKEALDIVESFENNVENTPEPDILSCKASQVHLSANNEKLNK